ncbi:MAG TPA: helix-turn-helix domain-containing protein [Gammaproteobacteria bacterium]|nr:helix-turn-helix domain-containing protein [Gammaproteobacteria bacterium]
MYHYTGCGLRNVYLKNGYKVRETAYGKTVAVEDLDGLHQAIACDLINYKPKLTGTEFRFLRKELGMSQKRLAELLSSTEQSVSLWERKGSVPKWADRMIRLLYLEYMQANPSIVQLVDKLNHLDRAANAKKRLFKDTGRGWKPDRAA